MWSSFASAVKAEYNAINIWPREAPVNMVKDRSSAPHSAYSDESRGNPPLKSPSLGVHLSHNIRISHRTSLNGDTITVRGWPSRGGIIILENATPPDFDFLSIDHLDPPLRRNSNQIAEDAFCLSLLRLGATWWDSEARRRFVSKLEYGDEEAHDAVNANEDLKPTRRERGWVRVAWPSHTPGALCVLECEKIIMGRAGGEKLRPRHYGLISLARTMDERCTVLQRLGGTMYASIEEYQGPTFLKAWEGDHQGERGPLLKEEFIDPASYGGHPDDALGTF